MVNAIRLHFFGRLMEFHFYGIPKFRACTLRAPNFIVYCVSIRGSYSCIPLLNVSATTGYPTLLNPYSHPSCHPLSHSSPTNFTFDAVFYDLRIRKYVIKEATSQNGIQRSLKRSSIYIKEDAFIFQSPYMQANLKISVI